MTNEQKPDTTLTWPTHPDGRPKKMGEMSKEEQRAHTVAALQRIKREIEHPLMREAILRGPEENS